MDFVSVGMNAVSVADEFGMLVKRVECYQQQEEEKKSKKKRMEVKYITFSSRQSFKF